MSDISTWDTTAANNNSTPPDGAPENSTKFSDVNNIIREVMAAVRRQWEDKEWFDYGETPTFVSTTSFTLVGDQTADFLVGRRLRATQGVDPTVYGTVLTSVFTSLTTVTMTMDGASVLTANLASVALGANPTGDPISAAAVETTASGVLQIQNNSIATRVACSHYTSISAVPPNTEGTELITVSITPQSASSKLVIRAVVTGNAEDSSYIIAALHQDVTVNALAAVTSTGGPTVDYSSTLVLEHIVNSTDTTARTFKLRAGHVGSGKTFGVNGLSGSATAHFGGTVASTTLSVTEIL